MMNIYIPSKGMTFKKINPYECEARCQIDTPENREFDKAASEVLKMAKVWFTKTSFGGAYEITHWGDEKIATYEDMKEIINKMYPKSLASKIIDLLEGASMNFVISGVGNLTQFKEFWNHYFRPMVKAA